MCEVNECKLYGRKGRKLILRVILPKIIHHTHSSICVYLKGNDLNLIGNNMIGYTNEWNKHSAITNQTAVLPSLKNQTSSLTRVG